MAITAVKLLPNGVISKASILDPLVDDVTSLDARLTPMDGAWTDFSATFTVTAATTNPTKGDSVYNASYVKMGKTTHYVFRVLIGSTFAAGSGTYRFLLPVAASTRAVAAAMGHGQILDSGTAIRHVVASIFDSTHVILTRDDSAINLDNTGPGTVWATNDEIRCAITYEAA